MNEKRVMRCERDGKLSEMRYSTHTHMIYRTSLLSLNYYKSDMSFRIWIQSYSTVILGFVDWVLVLIFMCTFVDFVLVFFSLTLFIRWSISSLTIFFCWNFELDCHWNNKKKFCAMYTVQLWASIDFFFL